jgi:hypothetical protein
MGGDVMSEDVSKNSYKVDWAHLLFLLIIGGAMVWYLYDAVSVSTSADNLLLVAPISGVALILVITLAVQCISARGKARKPTSNGGGIKEMGASELRSSDLRSLGKIGGVAGALGAYVFLLDVIGFDVSAWLFIIVVMLLCGERRPLVLVIYSLLVSVILIGGFRAILPFPMYTLIL